jgi:hypothetical protein
VHVTHSMSTSTHTHLKLVPTGITCTSRGYGNPHCGLASSLSCPHPVTVILLIAIVVVFLLSSRTPYAPCEQLLTAVVGGAGCSPVVLVLVVLVPSPMFPISTPRAGARGGSWGVLWWSLRPCGPPRHRHQKTLVSNNKMKRERKKYLIF